MGRRRTATMARTDGQTASTPRASRAKDPRVVLTIPSATRLAAAIDAVTTFLDNHRFKGEARGTIENLGLTIGMERFILQKAIDRAKATLPTPPASAPGFDPDDAPPGTSGTS